MILKKGNMWSVQKESGLWLFTGNSYVNRQGGLVMGRGLAKEAKARWQYLPEELGRWMLKTCGHLGEYGVMPAVGGNAGVFQVKHHFKANAELALIGYSVLALQKLIQKRGPGRVDLNFPGIGYGRLDRAKVLPIIEELPDTVYIWEKA